MAPSNTNHSPFVPDQRTATEVNVPNSNLSFVERPEMDRQTFLAISLSCPCASCPSCEHVRTSGCQQNAPCYHELRTTSFLTCSCGSFSSSPSFSPPFALASPLTSKSTPDRPMYHYTPIHHSSKLFLSRT